jgi:hypothetical protein
MFMYTSTNETIFYWKKMAWLVAEIPPAATLEESQDAALGGG